MECVVEHAAWRNKRERVDVLHKIYNTQAGLAVCLIDGRFLGGYFFCVYRAKHSHTFIFNFYFINILLRHLSVVMSAYISGLVKGCLKLSSFQKLLVFLT